MAHVIPLLPCASIEEVADFASSLGFEVTYRQQRPNPYVALQDDVHGIEVHYFGIDGFEPQDSYGSCVILVPDTEVLYDAWSAGLRERYGRLPLTGLPRITRPRRRANAGHLSGFSLIDPGGNWLRVMRQAPDPADADAADPGTPLARAVANAVVLADSHGDLAQARKILAGALRRADDAGTGDRVEALALLAELHTRAEDHAALQAALADLDEVAATLDESARVRHAATLGAVADLRGSSPDGRQT